MAGILKTIIRFGVIGGLVVGAAAVIAGPHRVAALAHQARAKIVGVIDANIDDPIEMRAQLRSLEAQYPAKIAEVRSHLAAIEQQIKEVNREQVIAERVVSLSSADLEEMQDLLARAEEAKATGEYTLVRVAFENRTYNLEAAYRRATDISETVNIYNSRIADCGNDLASLEGDAESLRGLLGKLQGEHSQFQVQLANLERQIDAVARKERMVSMMAERQKKLDQLSDYRVASLDQFRGRLAQKQAELDAQIASLNTREERTSYEDAARVQIDRETSARLRFETSKGNAPAAPVEKTIEIGSESAPTGSSSAGRVAARTDATIR